MTLSCLWACCLCQVFEKKWEHFHQLICMLPISVVVFVYFSADCEQSLFFFRFNEGRARASVRRHDKRGRLKPSCACSHARSPRRKKRETARRLIFYRPCFS